jgi:hypothetical protein
MSTKVNIERAIIHAQLRLMSTDDDALDDAERYLVRALGALWDLRANRRPALTVVPLSVKEVE